MGEFGEELIGSLKQAAEHAKGGKVRGMRVTTVELPDVKAIRRALDMSQDEFAAVFRIPLATLKNWEQGPASTGCSGGCVSSRHPAETQGGHGGGGE